MSRLIYEDLVDNYNTNLDNMLRGFHNHQNFLEMWVPDADHVDSIVNMLESASGYGVKEVSLSLASNTVEELDRKRLEEEAKDICILQFYELAQGGLELKAIFNTDTVSFQEPELPFVYLERINEILQNVRHERALLDDSENLLVRSTYQGINLFASVNSKYQIVEVAFSGTATVSERGIMEGLCRLIVGVPIWEAAEHGVLKLEYDLRAGTKPLVDGIVNRFNWPKMFDIPHILLRDLHKIVQEKTDLGEKENFYTPKISQQWIDFSENEKVEKIQGFLNQFATKQNWSFPLFYVEKVERQVKVYVVPLITEIDYQVIATELMAFEVWIRKMLSVELQIYIEPLKDKNKLRRI